MRSRFCIVSGCGIKHYGLGYCKPHYQRFKNFGSPQDDKPFKTEKGSGIKWIEIHKNYEGKECLIWPFWRHRKGHAMVDIYHGTKMKKQAVCRIMCEFKHGPPPSPTHEAAHSCGKGHTGCANPNHLSWKTHAENMADMIGHGTTTRGEKQHMCRLTPEQVLAIRETKETHKQIAAQYGVSRQTVGLIKSRKNWAWL